MTERPWTRIHPWIDGSVYLSSCLSSAFSFLEEDEEIPSVQAFVVIKL